MQSVTPMSLFPLRVEAAFRLIWHVEAASSAGADHTGGPHPGSEVPRHHDNLCPDWRLAATRSAYEVIRNFINGELILDDALEGRGNQKRAS